MERAAAATASVLGVVVLAGVVVPTQGWARQVPSSGFDRGARMVHAQSGWEIDIAQDPDATWAVDRDRRCG